MYFDMELKMKHICEKCQTELEICKGVFPFSEDYLICPKCDSTYVIDNETTML